MSLAVTVGLDQRFRSQSRRISSNGEVRCLGFGFGEGSSANVNFSSVPFGIEGFLGVLGNAAIENKFVFRRVAQIYCYDEALGIGAGFLVVVEAGGGAELPRSFDAVPRVCLL